MSALGNLKSALVQNPSKNESSIISKRILNFHKEAISFVQLQPGLNIENDPDIILDESFSDYNKWRLQLRHDLDCYAYNPLKAFDYFANVAQNYGRFTVMIANASKTAQAKKASTSE